MISHNLVPFLVNFLVQVHMACTYVPICVCILVLPTSVIILRMLDVFMHMYFVCICTYVCMYVSKFLYYMLKIDCIS